MSTFSASTSPFMITGKKISVRDIFSSSPIQKISQYLLVQGKGIRGLSHQHIGSACRFGRSDTKSVDRAATGIILDCLGKHLGQHW